MLPDAIILPALVILPLLAAALPTLFKARTRLDPSLAAGAVTLIILLAVLSLRAAVFAGETLYADWEWIPALGLRFSFRMDGLGFLFALLIGAIGSLVVLYARYYLGDWPAPYGITLVLDRLSDLMIMLTAGRDRAQRQPTQAS